ncbi:MAG: hypothetical protein J7M38_07065 [Armatimonadetes bacterium]|nr:hypothetical protein [Armatimonadota bacterium]
MISAIDVLSIAIAVTLIAIEGQRGLMLAVVDLAGAIGAIALAGLGYVWLSQYVGSYSTAYLLWMILGLLLTATIGVYLTLATKEHVRGWEAALGAVVGFIISMVVSYGLYNYLEIKYGSGAAFLRNSLLAYQFSDHGLIYEFARFARTLSGR